MAIHYNLNTRNCRTAKEVITKFPQMYQKDGYYALYPGADVVEIVYCDMTTDGGGWMLAARSHPTTVNYNGQYWGWRGGKIGSVKDFNQAYQSGWFEIWHNMGLTFTDYIYGNRSNINNNTWGSFVYKVGISNYTTFMGSDTQQSGSSYTTLKSGVGVYQWTSFPGMQGAIGYPITGTLNNLYYMRDCCGFSGYGGTPTYMSTTYCGSDSVLAYSGPWCGGSSTDGSGNFLSGTYLTAGNNRYGGTNQYMIMVR